MRSLAAPGQNSELNAEKLPLTLASSTDKPSIVTSSHASQQGESQTEKPADAQKLLAQASFAEELERPSHESTKTLLTVAAIGSVIIYYTSGDNKPQPRRPEREPLPTGVSQAKQQPSPQS